MYIYVVSGGLFACFLGPCLQGKEREMALWISQDDRQSKTKQGVEREQAMQCMQRIPLASMKKSDVRHNSAIRLFQFCLRES